MENASGALQHHLGQPLYTLLHFLIPFGASEALDKPRQVEADLSITGRIGITTSTVAFEHVSVVWRRKYSCFQLVLNFFGPSFALYPKKISPQNKAHKQSQSFHFLSCLSITSIPHHSTQSNFLQP